MEEFIVENAKEILAYSQRGVEEGSEDEGEGYGGEGEEGEEGVGGDSLTQTQSLRK